MNKRLSSLLLSALAIQCSLCNAGTVITVSPDSSVSDAFRKVREMRRLEKVGSNEKVCIRLADTTYRLYQPIVLHPEDHDIEVIGTGTFSAISGGMIIDGWKKDGRYWTAEVPYFEGRPLSVRQMWVNGRKAVRCRDVDDFEKMHRIVSQDKKKGVIYVPASAVKDIMPADSVYFNRQAPEMILHEMWCISVLRIRSITIHGDSAAVRFMQPEAKLQFEHPWPNVMTGEHASPFYITGHKNLLDAEREFFYDERRGKLYYIPGKDEDMTTAEVIVPALESLVIADGSLDNNVRNINFKNITFEHTTWTRPALYGHVPLQACMYLTDAYKLRPQMTRKDNHKLDNQGFLGRPEAAIEIKGAERLNFTSCIFRHLGGQGIDYQWGDKDCTVDSCTLTDIAMNGYVCGSFSPSSLETHIVYNPSDKREVCEGNTITRCTITDIGNEDWGSCAIAAGYVAGQQITDNTISDIPYTGISLGWGWNRQPGVMHDNYVAGNDISRYGRHMYDTAGIYTLGCQPGTIIEENSIYDIYTPSYVHDPNHWFYLYTDEGSSHITVRNNHTQGEKFLKNAVGPGNVWENNGPWVKTKTK